MISQNPLDLPQSPDTWYFAVRRLRTWIVPEDEPPVRPYLTLILNLDRGLIQGSALGAEPTPADARETLFSTMTNPEEKLGVRTQRPACIQFEEQKWLEALSSDLQQIDVQASFHPHIQMVDELVAELESALSDDAPFIPGLLAQKRVSPRLVGNLFAAAADFYRAAPWVHLGNNDLLAITIPPRKKPFFVIVMGQGGIEYGLGLYKTWNEVMRQFQPVEHFEELFPPKGRHVLFFNPVTEVPFDDLDALETYGWDLADSQAYPVPLIFFGSGEVRRPNRDIILWYEAALRAIPQFVQEHLPLDEAGRPQPAEARLQVSTSAGQTTVNIKYPGGELPAAANIPFPAFDLEDLEEPPEPPFDRRVMEGEMARMFESLEQESIDPQVAEAQNLMYAAWEEQNPARRIAMARKALKVSPDCADAYVLLAEEEADTVGRSLELYQQGAEAGKRALGEAYFQENAGHFWGLLRTRPYMRALEGMAACLWQMKLEDKALKVYQEMLRLNPNDNQGIRYLMINLLLGLNRDDELSKLLDEYQDDWSAVWTYSQALLEFRQSGASPKANRGLRAALEQNPLVPAYLSGKKRIPNQLPAYIGMGDENEAIAYAADHLNHWRRTPGALNWLEEQLADSSG